ncbi:MAG: hypothetical protein NTW87_04935 [Planctomycetota bacterium]|nr:hypothetical protein [Planctomycetota bacterium]
MLLLAISTVLSVAGPWRLARGVLPGGWRWGRLALTVVFWHGIICLSGIASALVAGRFSSPAFGVTACVLSLAMWLLVPPLPQETEVQSASPEPARRWELWPLLGLAAAVLLWDLYALDVLPVRIHETLNYRAVMVGLWMQGEPLRGFESSSFLSFSYPANAELLQLWWCIHPHCDRWIELPQWLSAIALADLVGLLAADAGLPRAACWWAAALAVLTPAVAIQAATEQDDLITTAAFTAALIFTRRWLSGTGPLRWQALAAGAGLGLALGAKVTIIPLCVPLLIWLAVCFRRIRARELAAFAVPFLALGLYFYVDNLVRLGNPLYPFPVRLFGVTLFEADAARGMPAMVPGLPNLAVHLAKAPLEWFELHKDVSAYLEESGFGGAWPALLLPGVVVAALWALWNRRPEHRSYWALALVAASGQLALWSNTPWTPFDLRYSLHLPALAAVAAAFCWCRCPGRWRAGPALAAVTLGISVCGENITNNWNSPLGRITELRKLPFEERTYARLGTTPEARLFQQLEASDAYPESRSVAVLSGASSLKSAAFGPRFQRRVWLPDAARMQGPLARTRWRHELDARQVDAVLVIDHAVPWHFEGYREAQQDLQDPSRWNKVYEEKLGDRTLLAFRRAHNSEEARR